MDKLETNTGVDTGTDVVIEGVPNTDFNPNGIGAGLKLQQQANQVPRSPKTGTQNPKTGTQKVGTKKTEANNDQNNKKIQEAEAKKAREDVARQKADEQARDAAIRTQNARVEAENARVEAEKTKVALTKAETTYNDTITKDTKLSPQANLKVVELYGRTEERKDLDAAKKVLKDIKDGAKKGGKIGGDLGGSTGAAIGSVIGASASGAKESLARIPVVNRIPGLGGNNPLLTSNFANIQKQLTQEIRTTLDLFRDARKGADDEVLSNKDKDPKTKIDSFNTATEAYKKYYNLAEPLKTLDLSSPKSILEHISRIRGANDYYKVTGVTFEIDELTQRKVNALTSDVNSKDFKEMYKNVDKNNQSSVLSAIQTYKTEVQSINSATNKSPEANQSDLQLAAYKLVAEYELRDKKK